jgi:hypothetical protein
MSDTNEDSSSFELAEEILGYLQEHPDAEDTLEGIEDWWMLERNIKSLTSRLQAALAYLVSSGFLIQRVSQDSRTYYRVNPSWKGGPTKLKQ